MFLFIFSGLCYTVYFFILTVTPFIIFFFVCFLSFLLFPVSNFFTISTLVINRNVLISFLVPIDSASFTAKFNLLELSVEGSLGRLDSAAVSVSKETAEILTVKQWRRNSALKESQFRKIESLVLRFLATERIRELLSFFLCVHTFTVMEWQIQELLFHFFMKRNVSVGLLNGARFLQSVVDNGQAEVHITYEISVQKVFKAQIYFHAVAWMRRGVGKSKLNIF